MRKYVMAKEKILECLLDSSEITDHHGVIGTAKVENGLPEYVYGEITGYFLSFCSYVCRRNPVYKEHLTPIMASHIAWLTQLVKNGFVTRCPINSKEDWRNSAIFAFDIAMIIRGLQDSATIVDSSEALKLYLEKFTLFIDYNNKTLKPVINVGKESLPDKWSTRKDIHYTKIVANVIPAFYERNKKIEFDILKNLLSQFDNYDIDNILNVDSHPLFYYLEGIALASKKDFLHSNSSISYIERISSIYKRLVQLTGGIGLLDNPINGSYKRSDVLAQYVRIGVLLQMSHKLNNQEKELIGIVLDCILEEFYLDGRILFFDKTQMRNNTNTWCAMFLYQAIDFYLISSENSSPGLEDFLWNSLF